MSNQANEPDIGELEIADELIAERNAFKPGETPEDMTAWQRPIVASIDVMNLWVGRFTCLMLLPIICAMVYEVVSRSSFGFLAGLGMDQMARDLGLGPTLWAYEATRMFAGAMFMLGAGYALMRGVHIRADFLYRNWSDKTQATVDSALYLLFYFPAMVFFLWVSTEYATKAWVTGERAMDTTMMAPLAPARTAMPLGVLFLLLQGISELFKAFHKMGPERERTFLKAIPFYLVILTILTLSIFAKDIMPIGDVWSDFVKDVGLSDRAMQPWIGVVMLGVMLFSIFVGFPISFTLIFLGFAFGAWGFGTKLVFFLQTLQFNSVMLEETLAAVPLFVFMGIMMEKAGLMERLFTSVQLMLSSTRGALYIAVLFVSTIFAAATGIVGASVTILGIMAARTMNKSGYNVQLAAGTITAGGTLGILIPPSIMLVVMGPVLEIPVTDLFAAAIIPGIMLATLYMLYALGRCWLNEDLGPPLPEDECPITSDYYTLEVFLVLIGLIGGIYVTVMAMNGGFSGLLGPFGFVVPVVWAAMVWFWHRSPLLLKIALPIVLLAGLLHAGAALMVDPSIVTRVIYGLIVSLMILTAWLSRILYTGEADNSFFFSDLWGEFYKGLVPPAALVAFALGSILLGFATPTEAAGCGAFGALLLTMAYRKFTIPGAYDSLIKTLEITVLIMFLVAASNFFGATFSRLGTPTMLTEIMLGFDLSVTWVLIIIMILIFLLGWPLEWVPIVLIIVPIMVPVLVKLDVDLTWFAILVAVNLQTAWLSPPVALSAYFLKGVVPEWDLKDIYLGMMQFMVIQLIGLFLVFNFPQIALWLPRYLYGE